jgi:hypothetical protein
MKLPRRRCLHLAAGTAALPAFPRFAGAQAYPTRPLRIIVGYTAGGVSDILARLIGRTLSERLGQPFVIENRPGAGSNIATELVVPAPPDGYTLLLAGVVNASNVALFDDLNFNFIRDIAPVAIVGRSPLKPRDRVGRLECPTNAFVLEIQPALGTARCKMPFCLNYLGANFVPPVLTWIQLPPVRAATLLIANRCLPTSPACQSRDSLQIWSHEQS